MLRKIGPSLLVLLLAVTAFVSGCEKERKTRFVQGDGEYVYTIDEFKTADYTLKTGSKLTRGVTTKADQVVVNHSSVIRAYDAVEFSLETDFGTFDNASMSNFQFFGKENWEYPIRVQFTEDNLIFFKIAEEQAIPSDEMTYAEKVEGNLYRVPLFGLPLSKYTVERVKDDRGKSSNQVKSYTEKFLKDATHFAVKATNPKYFETELKLDMFPSKFFEPSNEWFFEVTVVDRPLDNNSTYELGYQLASGKAKFYKTNKTLTVVSQNTPDELKDQDPEKQTTILEIPAHWMDFRLMTTGEDAFLKEEVFNDIAAGAKYWNERNYVQLQFDKILSDVLGTDAVVANTLRVKRLEVADDYFSFIVFDALSKISLHFSFAKENRVVDGHNYPLEDWKTFGFFKAFKSVLVDTLYSAEESQIKSAFIQRMYPKDNVVRFHITENTPRDPVFIEAIEAAVKAWDEAFAKAAVGTPHEGNPIRVVFDKDAPVQNGDARYHKVSFYGYEVASGLLGYGPSVADDRNGETFSSTNHIYLRNYREQILRNLVKYVRFRLGVYNDLEVQGIELPNQILATADSSEYPFGAFVGAGEGGARSGSALSLSALPDENATKALAAFEELTYDGMLKAQADALALDEQREKDELASYGRKNKGYRDFLRARQRLASGIDDEAAFSQAIQKSVAQSKTAGTCDYLAGTALSFKEIEEVCMSEGNRFKTYLEDLLAKNQAEGLDYRLEDEKDVFYDCAQKLMKPTLISTLVHEFGHNFGLTHNFAGSSDAKNFRRNKHGIPEVRSTSVMDYAHRDADRGFEPGPYDIATIRYGYYQSVEVDKANGERGIVSIQRKPGDISSIKERLQQQDPGVQLHPYSYCWDYDIASGELPVESPTCRRWDQGSDPVAQVRSFIDDFNTYMITNSNRFDNYGAATSVTIGNGVVANHLVPMKLLYDKYRYSLYEKAYAKGYNDPYFDNLTMQEIEEQVIGTDDLARVAGLKAEIIETQKNTANAVKNTLAIEAKVQALPEIAQYKLASEFIKDFYRQIIFSNDLYCVVTGRQGGGLNAVDIQPFAALRKTIFNADGSDAIRCEDANVLSYYRNLLASGKVPGFDDIEGVISVGNPSNDILYSADIQKLPIRKAIRAGFNGLRLMAIAVLSDRSDAIGVNLFQTNRFFPSLLDEDSFRRSILDDIRVRYVEGINGKAILAQASKKIGQSIGNGSFATLADQNGKFNLPYYEEEGGLIQTMLAAYRAGAISPLSVTNDRIADIQVSTSSEVSFQTFLRTVPDAYAYDYFIAGSNAYYSKGATASAILGSIRETLNNVTLADNMASSVTNGQLNEASLQQIRARLAQFAKDFHTKETSGDSTANSVLFKVRVCVKDRLITKYQSKLEGYQLESDPDFAYIQAICRKVGSSELAEDSAAIADYFVEADRILDFYVANDGKALSIALLESVLTKVGLPTSPDKEKDTTTIVNGALAAKLQAVGPASLFESRIVETIATTLVDTKLNPNGKEKLYSIANDPNALDVEIKAATAKRFKALAPYARYRDLYKKKVDILQTAIFNSALR